MKQKKGTQWVPKKQEDPGLLARLSRPTGPVDVVLDTDTYNEIDDQFAVSYLICSAEKLHLQAIYAAPFFNEKSTGPADGMEKSYQEILNILTLMGKDELKKSVYKGSTGYLPDEETAVESPAAADLAARAMNYTPEKPLYVLAIGAITNVASAILKNPDIIDRIVIVWLGGNYKTIIVTGMSVAIFGSVLSLYTDFMEVSSEKLKLIETLGGTRRDILCKILIPANIPSLLSIMKVDIGLCLVGVIIGEFIASRKGLGFLIIYGSQVFKLDWVLMSIIILCLIAIGLYVLIHGVEKWYVKRL